MIVEDEAIVLMDTVMLVEDLGFDIHSECSTISEALGALESSLPDVALLDINIRTELIWPVARKLKNQGSKIIFTSANSRHAELQTEFAECQFVEKPVSSRDLREALLEATAADRPSVNDAVVLES
ncbi:response regulator [Litorisediminicola beolgyonensis]|uniref:Response regulator n=2 Tax=Litorisediminicola beolgyonensis TaxID=1173614 RepID=A0ABW3ZHC7_9RHOB